MTTVKYKISEGSIPSLSDGIYRTQTIHCISVFNGINFALKRSRFLNYASFQTSVRNIPNNEYVTEAG